MDLSEQQKPLQRQTLKRRGKEQMRALAQQMRALEATKTRSQIALALGLTPAMVTRLLGAKRRWRDRRAGTP